MVLFKSECYIVDVVFNNFTFHYGPIQIELHLQFLHCRSFFTFHYGPIQIIKITRNKTDNMFLHSTMVLFKLMGNYYLLQYLNFTFHYGPIQIEDAKPHTNREHHFTFHYGPIQILFRQTNASYY